MKKMNILIILLFTSTIYLSSQDATDREKIDRGFFAHGPRMGATLIYDSNNNEWGVLETESILLNKDIPPLISQFGYHADFSLYMSNKMNPLVQFDGLIGGVENGLLIPSLSMIIGLRFSDFLEIGLGPNISLSGTGIVLAIGFNIKVENIYYPINVAIVNSSGRYRYSLLTGFNSP